jgi:3-hydroxyisobutyrate dehydrogenase-like beta-hydroxyacid dehydrogenase
VSAGHSTKLLHQFVVLGNAAILAEAFSCASKAGVNLDVLCDVIDTAGANSTAFQRMRPYMQEGNAHKDMRYYAGLTAAVGVVSHLGDAVHNTYTLATDEGHAPQFIPHLIDSLNTLNATTPDSTQS